MSICIRMYTCPVRKVSDLLQKSRMAADAQTFSDFPMFVGMNLEINIPKCDATTNEFLCEPVADTKDQKTT